MLWGCVWRLRDQGYGVEEDDRALRTTSSALPLLSRPSRPAMETAALAQGAHSIRERMMDILSDKFQCSKV